MIDFTEAELARLPVPAQVFAGFLNSLQLSLVIGRLGCLNAPSEQLVELEWVGHV